MYCPFILFFIPSLSTYSKTVLHDATKETYSLSGMQHWWLIGGCQRNQWRILSSPSVGAQVKLTQKLKMNIALSYEIQQLETLKQRTDEYFHTEFKEELSHHSITLKVGLTY